MKFRTCSEKHASPYPVPPSVPATDETPAQPQTEDQRLAAKRLLELAEIFADRLSIDRRRFLGTTCGMAAAFLAMNSVYGSFFRVDAAEAAAPEASGERTKRLSRQKVFDVQTHYVGDSYSARGMLSAREAAKKWNPRMKGEQNLDKLRFGNYVREVFLESDTTLALISGAPGAKDEDWFLQNEEIAEGRRQINRFAGSRRAYAHAVFTPGRPGWMEALDRALELKPDSWKGYTVSEPFNNPAWHWRLDDEKLVYPAYEKMMKAGITTVCIHKGLLPKGYREQLPQTWRNAGVEDVAKAARDWPRIRFVIYHSAIREGGAPSADVLGEFERTGYIPWVSDLAEIPAKYGVRNVYAELGTVFATTVISSPRYCAGILGTLIRGMGSDHVVWGTDSVWYGSPQWQIEAFRRLEIPEELRRRFGYPELGADDGSLRSAILYGNSAKMYNVPDNPGIASDRLAHLKERREEPETF